MSDDYEKDVGTDTRRGWENLPIIVGIATFALLAYLEWSLLEIVLGSLFMMSLSGIWPTIRINGDASD